MTEPSPWVLDERGERERFLAAAEQSASAVFHSDSQVQETLRTLARRAEELGVSESPVFMAIVQTLKSIPSAGW